jgi:DHA2 family multidrug resistance protein
MLSRRTQVHQANLAAHTANSNQMQSMLHTMSSVFATRLGSGPQALQQAYGSIYGTLQQQASVLGYKDTIVVMAVLTVAVMPLVLLARKPKPGEARMGH